MSLGDSSVIREDQHAEVTRCNREGMERLRQGDNKTALELLLRADEILSNHHEGTGLAEDANRTLTRAQAVTASNLGIYHKRKGDFQRAISYLEKALQLHESCGADLQTLAGAHLNLCACFSQAEIHEQALRHATTAVEHMGRFIADTELGECQSEEGQIHEAQPDDYATLAIAYHNVAMARESLRQWGDATLAYTQAYEVVIRSLGPDHALTKAFEQTARCPKQPKPPEEKRTWRSVPSSVRLPDIPRTKPNSVGPLHQDYTLDGSVFPQWPPSNATTEEKRWYRMAKAQRIPRHAGAASLYSDTKIPRSR
jgi:tetratricopeptide (TPR) repeat protein